MCEAATQIINQIADINADPQKNDICLVNS